MDTLRELYIKMCDCPEVQKGHKFQDGDILATYRQEWKKVDKDTQKAHKVFDGMVIYSEAFTNILERDLVTWLPMQHQIQEMAGLPVSAWGLFYGWIFSKDEKGKEPWQYFDTGEKLWLAFYMNQKYSKRWDLKEEKWMKE